MKLIWKILLGIFGLILLFAAYIQFAPPPKFDLEMGEISISTDSATLARGEYLIYGPAHCFGCHSMIKDSTAIERGEKVALAGGKYFDTPMGKIYIPNITPDPETGIGKLSNQQIARAMRYAINHKGKAMIPAMPFTHMSETDVSAIISYLRAQPPVKNEVPGTGYNLLGKALQKFLLRPYKKTQPILKHVEPGPTLEYGAYLTKSVANCEGCHTTFNINTMSYDGVPLSGGSEMAEKIHIYRTPNLTPDPKTGHITNWTEDQFVARFQSGKVFEDSPMPWDAFKTMPEDDVRAIYKYLMSVPPCENEVGMIVAKKE